MSYSYGEFIQVRTPDGMVEARVLDVQKRTGKPDAVICEPLGSRGETRTRMEIWAADMTDTIPVKNPETIRELRNRPIVR